MSDTFLILKYCIYSAYTLLHISALLLLISTMERTLLVVMFLIIQQLDIRFHLLFSFGVNTVIDHILIYSYQLLV